jgi:hypothetical protein
MTTCWTLQNIVFYEVWQTRGAHVSFFKYQYLICFRWWPFSLCILPVVIKHEYCPYFIKYSDVIYLYILTVQNDRKE